MPNHVAYVAFDGDHIGREVERAGLADDPDRLRQLSQQIEAGNEAWRSWALSHGGDVISLAGDEGNLRVPADYLGEVADLREKYAKVVGASVSVGIGARLSEAGKSLMAAKLQGGDRVVMYEPEVDDILAQAKEKTEEQKISEAYLQKADQPALNSPAAGGGMTGPSQAPPSGPDAPASPGGDDKPADQGAAPASASPMQGADIHDILGSAADDQGQKDQDQQSARDAQADAAANSDDLKNQVLKILKVFQDRKDQLEQLKDQDPELYQSLVGMVQVLIAGARQLFGADDQGQEQGDGGGDKEPPKDTKKSEMFKSDKLRGLAQHLMSMQEYEANGGEKCAHCGREMATGQIMLARSQYPHDPGFCSPQCAISGHDKQSEAGKFADAVIAAQNAGPKPLKNSEPSADCKHFYGRSKKCLRCGNTKTEKAALEAGTTGRHDVVLPVGSQKDASPSATREVGQVKVQDPETGASKWRQVRAGLVMDPAGQPTSSRHPGG